MAATGEERLRALRTGTFECLLLDHNRPDMTGLEMLEQAMRPDGQWPCLAATFGVSPANVEIIIHA